MADSAAAISAAIAAHANADPTGVLDLMEDSSARSSSIDAELELDISDPSSGRALAAILQGNAVSERHHLGPLGDISHQRLQEEVHKQQFLPGNRIPPVALQTQHSPPLPTQLSPGSKDGSDLMQVTEHAQSPEKEAINALASNFSLGLQAAPPQTICLCKPPARIPRPRNAFILFRQHHHSQVVAEYPGKKNPEISKIIGAMWTNTSPEVKEVWQKHADEEKRQHLQMYPEYRFTPRRPSKKKVGGTSTSPGTASTAQPEPVLCPICGGKTAALNSSQAPAPSRRASHSLQNTIPPACKSNTQSPEASTPREILPNGVNVDHTSIDSLFQLDIATDQDIMLSSPKRRKISSTSTSNAPGGSIPALSSNSNLISHPIFDQSLSFSLHQPHFSPPPPDLDNNYYPHSMPESSVIRPLTITNKFKMITKLCPRLLAYPRMPIIALDGDNTDLIDELAQAIYGSLHSVVPIRLYSEPDVLNQLISDTVDTYIDDILGEPFGSGKNKDTDDNDYSKYLSQVSSWRQRSAEIRKEILSGTENTSNQPALVLINGYIFSRCESAALRLDAGPSPPQEHWAWCANIWKGTTGPDLTVYVVQTGQEVGGVDFPLPGLVVVKRAQQDKGWDNVIERLGIEHMIRTFREMSTGSVMS